MITKYIWFCLHFYRIRKEQHINLLTMLKNWCPLLSQKIIKLDFEAAVISVIHKLCADSVFTGCNFHFNQCMWRQIQIISLTVEYKEDKQVRPTCRMCVA